MAFFRRTKPPAKTAPSVIFTPQLIEVLGTFDGTAAGYGTLYRELAPVRTVVDFLADAVSTTSLKVYERAPSGRPEARGHPLAKLLRNPERTISARSLISQAVHDLAVYGNAYWRILRSGQDVAALVPLPPERVIPRGGDLQAAAQYDFTPLGGSVPIHLSREEVVHFRFFHPQDRRIGSSKLEALRPILAEEIEVSRHRQNFWRNAARFDFVITRPSEAPVWSNDDRQRFREDWQAAFSGREKAGKTAVLEEGMEPKAVSFSAKDSEFIQGRKFVLEAAARCYNIPLGLLGLTETATFASQREFTKALFQQTLPPWYELIQSEIEVALLPWFGEEPGGDIYVEFNVESKLRGSFEEQADLLTKAVGRPWMEVKEARQVMNLTDRGDPSDSELAIPANNVTLGTPPETEPAPPTVLRAAASAVPAARERSLKDMLDRQQRSVLSRVGAGGTFDIDRWNREMAFLVATWDQEATG